MGKNQDYKVGWSSHILITTFYQFQTLFEKIDKEDDGEVYLKEVVMFLKAVNEDIDSDSNMKVNKYNLSENYC